MIQSLLATLGFAGSVGLFCCTRSDGAAGSPHSSHSAPPVQASGGRIDIAVTADGFVPARVRVKVGQPVTLVVTRKVARTCATEIVIKEYGIHTPLPEGQPVEVTLTPKKPGSIRYACAMDMIAGELVVE